jgi:hypothetical protein
MMLKKGFFDAGVGCARIDIGAASLERALEIGLGEVAQPGR